MEFLSLEGWSVGGILAGLASIVIEARFEVIIRLLARRRLTHRIGFAISNNFIWRSVYWFFWAMVACLAILALQHWLEAIMWCNAYIVALAIFAWAIFSSHLRFSRVGLHAAQPSVATGTDYRASLDLCRDTFSFLGTGAAKLTSAENFDQVMTRCTNTTSEFRFLLSRPDNAIVDRAERIAGATTSDYSFKIRQSLRKLKKLKEERNVPIEVRFYPAVALRDFQELRMMFVDNSILLLSQNAYGKGDGSRLPQLVIRRARLLEAESSFYFAFDNYYKKLWESADIWDFITYLEK